MYVFGFNWSRFLNTQWLPESARFDATSGDSEKALATLQKIAEENGKGWVSALHDLILCTSCLAFYSFLAKCQDKEKCTQNHLCTSDCRVLYSTMPSLFLYRQANVARPPHCGWCGTDEPWPHQRSTGTGSQVDYPPPLVHLVRFSICCSFKLGVFSVLLWQMIIFLFRLYCRWMYIKIQMAYSWASLALGTANAKGTLEETA